MHTATSLPRIACSSRVNTDVTALLDFTQNNSFLGLEYSITSETKEALNREACNMELLGKSNLEIRYHTPFQNLELGHGDVAQAEASADFMKRCIDLVEDNGGEYITTHLCLGYRFSLQTLRLENAITYLSEVSNYATKKGVVICLENLTYGWTNNPHELLRIVEETGVSVTIDIGHIAASPMVVNNSITSCDFINLLSDHILSSHIYHVEIFDTKTNKPVHIAPQKTSDIKPTITELMKTKCSWWLIELGNKSEINHTRNILSEILLT